MTMQKSSKNQDVQQKARRKFNRPMNVSTSSPARRMTCFGTGIWRPTLHGAPKAPSESFGYPPDELSSDIEFLDQPHSSGRSKPRAGQHSSRDPQRREILAGGISFPVQERSIRRRIGSRLCGSPRRGQASRMVGALTNISKQKDAGSQTDGRTQFVPGAD